MKEEFTESRKYMNPQIEATYQFHKQKKEEFSWAKQRKSHLKQVDNLNITIKIIDIIKE